MRGTWRLLALLAWLAACDGAEGDVIVGPRPGPAAACPPETRGVWVIDAAGVLARFLPDGPALADVAPLSCEPRRACTGGAGAAAPVSMAIDRQGGAWVLYCSGELFRVDLRSARCEATRYTPPSVEFERFTMGFARGETGEALYVAGSAAPALLGRPREPAGAVLGALRLPEMAVERIAGLSGWPGLAGDEAGELLGLFPPAPAGPARLARLEPRSGAELWSVPVHNAAWTAEAPVIALSGADLWMFTTAPGGRPAPPDVPTVVQRPSRRDGQVSSMIVLRDRRVVAAASSPCAPGR